MKLCPSPISKKPPSSETCVIVPTLRKLIVLTSGRCGPNYDWHKTRNAFELPLILPGLSGDARRIFRNIF